MGLPILIVHVVVASVNATNILLGCYPQRYLVATLISLLLWFLLNSFVSVFSDKGQKGTLSSFSLPHTLFTIVLSCLLSLISKGGL